MKAAADNVRRRMKLGPAECVAIVWLGYLLGCASSARAADGGFVSLRGFTMGSTWSAKYRPAAATPPERDVERVLQARLDTLERQMSTWRADSDVSRFNASASTNWFPVPRDTAAVVREALAVSALTDGAFDVTVFPLVELWGFGPNGKKGRVPGDPEIAAALKRVGWRKLEARLDPPAVRKSQADVTVDLSAICPGYASDSLGELLEACGVRDYLVEVGGEFRARGNGALGPGWRVGVERAGDIQSPKSNATPQRFGEDKDGTASIFVFPRSLGTPSGDSPVGRGGDWKSPARALATTVTLTNQSLATSGDYRNFFLVNGRRFSHHLDPRTGRPTESAIASVTVVHPSATRADALGTALTVLGFEQAWVLAEREQLAVFFTLRHGDKLEARATARWPAVAKVD